MTTLLLWLLLRVISSIFAGLVSYFRPITPLERQIAMFPPSLPIQQWLERVFISPWMRWDALWFERIVSQGYSASDGTTPFHPLYPWLATPLAKIGISPSVSLLIISSLAGIALFYYFIKLGQIDLTPQNSYFALIAFSLAPPAFILFAPYSESLFLLLAVLCLYFMRKKTWWLAGGMGALAALTRQQGVFLIFPLAWELWESTGRNLKTLYKYWKEFIAICLPVAGLLIWMVYRAFFISDFSLNFSNIQGFIYSTIISPSASVIVPVQKFIWPWQAIYYAFGKLFSNPDVDIWVNVVLAILLLVVLAISWKKMRMSYRIYCLVIAVVSLSFYTGPVHPYMGLPRHLLLGFPMFIGFASAVKKPWLRIVITILSSIALLFLLMVYILRSWVP